MALIRIFLQVLAVCAATRGFPVLELGSPAGTLAAASSADDTDYLKQAQEAHITGTNMFAKVMYGGLADVIQSVLKMVSERVAESKSGGVSHDLGSETSNDFRPYLIGLGTSGSPS
ncbi:uncharacterized protein LOC134530855 [Bacillus rossius redtenbacheri]|uniref:uncharacterized protein LOC134530855 n=1 Tax=Bacillus rossius redtenbacheri TaxID=93214 RepID=UPI002FDE28E8